MFTIDKQIMTCTGGLVKLILCCIALPLLMTKSWQPKLPARCCIICAPNHNSSNAPRRTRIARSASGNQKGQPNFGGRIGDRISLPKLCRQIKMPQCKLERLFAKNVGCTIVQFYRFVRLQYARTLLVRTSMDIRKISVASGFKSMSYFSLCFAKTFGRKPSQYRLAWPEAETAPSWPGTMYTMTHDVKAHQAEKSALRNK